MTAPAAKPPAINAQAPRTLAPCLDEIVRALEAELDGQGGDERTGGEGPAGRPTT